MMGRRCSPDPAVRDMDREPILFRPTSPRRPGRSPSHTPQGSPGALEAHTFGRATPFVKAQGPLSNLPLHPCATSAAGASHALAAIFLSTIPSSARSRLALVSRGLRSRGSILASVVGARSLSSLRDEFGDHARNDSSDAFGSAAPLGGGLVHAHHPGDVAWKVRRERLPEKVAEYVA